MLIQILFQERNKIILLLIATNLFSKMSGKTLSLFGLEKEIQQSRKNANTIIIKKLKEHSAKNPSTVFSSPLKKTCVFKNEEPRYINIFFSWLSGVFNNIFRLITGMCTVHGGCRVLGNDYMFQGGCGELSRFGVS